MNVVIVTHYDDDLLQLVAQISLHRSPSLRKCSPPVCCISIESSLAGFDQQLTLHYHFEHRPAAAPFWALELALQGEMCCTARLNESVVQGARKKTQLET